MLDPDIHSRKYIIHTVGPTYDQFDLGEGKALLGRCYASCLALAKEYKLRHIVSILQVSIVPYMMPCPGVPCISASPNGLPAATSADIGIKEINYLMDTEWHDVSRRAIYIVCQHSCGHKLESIAFISKDETSFAQLR